MVPAVFKTVGRASRGGRFDSCLFRMSPEKPRPPAIGRLLERPEIAAFFPRLSRPLVVRAVREEVEFARSRVYGEGSVPGHAAILDEDHLAAATVARLSMLAGRRLRKVLNGTGVILHTNLGRSPLRDEEWQAVESANCGYSNLELDIEGGERGQIGRAHV